jgi:hypothetical protein
MFSDLLYTVVGRGTGPDAEEREASELDLLQRVAMRLTWSAYLRDGALLERVASSTKTF